MSNKNVLICSKYMYACWCVCMCVYLELNSNCDSSLKLEPKRFCICLFACSGKSVSSLVLFRISGHGNIKDGLTCGQPQDSFSISQGQWVPSQPFLRTDPCLCPVQYTPAPKFLSAGAAPVWLPADGRGTTLSSPWPISPVGPWCNLANPRDSEKLSSSLP